MKTQLKKKEKHLQKHFLRIKTSVRKSAIYLSPFHTTKKNATFQMSELKNCDHGGTDFKKMA